MAQGTEGIGRRAINDAGEKIGGARKDWRDRQMTVADLAELTAAEQVEHVKKDNIWPPPDYAALVEDGMDPGAAALVKIIRDRLAAQPEYKIYQVGTRTVREHAKVVSDYVRMLSLVRDVYTGCRTVEEVNQAKHVIFEKIGGRDAYQNPEIKHLIWSIYKSKSDPLVLQAKDLGKARTMLKEGFPGAVPAWRKGVTVRKGWNGNICLVKAKRVIGDGFSSEDNAWAWLQEQHSAKKSKKSMDEPGSKMPERPHLKHITRKGPDVRQGRDIGSEEFIETFGFRAVEFGNWLPDDERQTVLNYAFDALHDLADALGLDPQDLSLNGTLAVAFGARGKGNAAAHYEPGRRVFNLTRLSGAGSIAHEWGHALDHFAGNVGLEDWDQGGIRFGSGYHTHLKSLTKLLHNLPEPAALAWDRLLDTIRTRPLTQAEMVAKQEDQIAALRAEMAQIAQKEEAHRSRAEGNPGLLDKTLLKKVAAWTAQQTRVLAAAETRLAVTKSSSPNADFGHTTSEFFKEAHKISGQAGYWTRPTELFARAFEATVLDRLKSMDRHSDYLVYGVEGDAFIDEIFKGNPYPAGREREEIGQAIKDVIDAMRPTLELTESARFEMAL